MSSADSSPSAATAWLALAAMLTPQGALGKLFLDALPPLPALAAVPSRLAQVALEDPERYRVLVEDLYQRQWALWSGLAGPAAGSASETLDTLPWFRVTREQHEIWRAWVAGLIPLVGTADAEARRAGFLLRQWIEAADPRNCFVTNPEAISRAAETAGDSVQRGLANLARDIGLGRISMSDESAFHVGRTLAATPGAVIHESAICQLIRYRPATRTVGTTPLLVIPPFINRFYVLDLQPHNSLVRYALAQGREVFMVSWRSACAETAHATWADYVRHGVLETVGVVLDLARASSLHLLGYCVGGTLAATAASVLSARSPSQLTSLTLLNTLLDFAEPGEIGVYLEPDAPEIPAQDEPVMPGARLAAAFASLRARELVWHFVTHNYLMGDTPPPLDLLHWNGDAADIPAPLFREYLRDMYRRNLLREPGALAVDGTPIDLRAIRAPCYVLASHTDHIVPWRSAYASACHLGSPVRFVLSQGGHIAGVVNPPDGRKSRGHRIGDVPSIARPAEQWFDAATHRAGSWWSDWDAWLAGHEAAVRRTAPRQLGNRRHPVVEPAPGRYVLEAAGALRPRPRANGFSNESEEKHHG